MTAFVGLGQFRIDPSPKSKKTFISLPDKGLLRRFTGESTIPRINTVCTYTAVAIGSDLPHNTAPPTDTSLRKSIAKEAETREPRLTLLHHPHSYLVSLFF